MHSDFAGPMNVGSEEMVSMNQLVDLVADIFGKRIEKRHVAGPLRWAPSLMLREGLERTYAWIEAQVRHATPLGTPRDPGCRFGSVRRGRSPS
jgi:GDP-D-mannose 3',5'-epimerase